MEKVNCLITLSNNENTMNDYLTVHHDPDKKTIFSDSPPTYPSPFLQNESFRPLFILCRPPENKNRSSFVSSFFAAACRCRKQLLTAS